MATFKKAAHIKALEKARDDLHSLADRMKDPQPRAHQIVGTAVDNGICMVTLAANALDGGSRSVGFSDNANWVSLMRGVHTTFWVSLHTHIHFNFFEICNQRKTTLSKGHVKFERHMNDAFKMCSLPTGRQREWKKFLHGLTVLRNKAAHPDPKLEQSDLEKLRAADLDDFISSSDALQLNPSQYLPVVLRVLGFFDEFLPSIKN